MKFCFTENWFVYIIYPSGMFPKLLQKINTLTFGSNVDILFEKNKELRNWYIP